MGWHGNFKWHLESDKSAFWAHFNRPGFFISPLSLTEREKQSSALFVYFKPFRSSWKQQKNIPYRCLGCSVLKTYDTRGSSEKSATLNTFNWYVKHLYLYQLNVKPVSSLRTIYMCINLEKYCQRSPNTKVNGSLFTACRYTQLQSMKQSVWESFIDNCLAIQRKIITCVFKNNGYPAWKITSFISFINNNNFPYCWASI